MAKVIEQKLETDKGRLPRPELIQNWSYDFSGISEFTFVDLYTYLIGSEEEYTAEKLKSFKSLQGYKLIADGHIQDCSVYKVKDMDIQATVMNLSCACIYLIFSFWSRNNLHLSIF